MKSYYIYKNWLIRLLMGCLLFVGTIICMLIEKMNKIQLDTVIGQRNNNKCLLTIYIVDTHFMLIFLSLINGTIIFSISSICCSVKLTPCLDSFKTDS